MVKADFPSAIDPMVKFLDRYTIRDVIRTGVLASIGWYISGSSGATAGIVLGAVLTEVKPGGKTLDAHLIDGFRWITTSPTVQSPEIKKLVDGSVILADDTVYGIVKVSSQDLEYLSEPAKRANRDTVSELLNGVDYPVEFHSRQRLVSLSEYQGASGSTVTTDHYVTVKSVGQSLAENRRQLKKRCSEIQELLTAADLYAEQLTGSELRSGVKQVYPGETSVSGTGYKTEHGQKRVCRMLYVDEYPDELPMGWIADVLNQDSQGLVDVVQEVTPVSDYQRNWMDRMVGRIQTELSASWKPSRQANLREQEHDLEYLIDAETAGKTLVNYGVYIVVRGDTDREAAQTLDSVKSVLNRFRVKTAEPRYSTQAIKAVSGFQTSRFDKSIIVPGDSAATGFSFGTKDCIEAGGVKIGSQQNGAPVILDRFGWEAGHITVMGKIGSGKTYWTGLTMLRSTRTYDNLEIYVIDPKKRDYGGIVDGLNGETVYIDRSDLTSSSNDVIRYTVEDPSRDNTEKLAEAVRHVYKKAVETDVKTLVVIDEAHRIITKGNRIYQDGVQAVSTLVRETRDRNVGVTLVTQNADEFTRSNEGRNILRNVDCNLFFKQKDVASELTDFFRLSERENTELRKLRTGNNLPFSEAIIHGPVNTRLKIKSEQEEHHLVENSEPEDKTVPSTQPAGSVESRPVENGEKPGRTDGGHKTHSGSTDTGSQQDYGFLKVIGRVLGAPIGLFECVLFAGLPVVTALYWNNTLTSVLPVTGLPFNGTPLDVLAVWTVTVVLVELLWTLVLSIDNWLVQPGK